MNLLVDGKAARTATGKNNEKLQADWWEVSELKGKKAKIEIVDQEKGGWGHINIDDIEFADAPPKEANLQPLDQQPDFGTMTLSVLDESFGTTVNGWPGAKFKEHKTVEFPLGETYGVLGGGLTISAGETKEIVFLIT